MNKIFLAGILAEQPEYYSDKCSLLIKYFNGEFNDYEPIEVFVDFNSKRGEIYIKKVESMHIGDVIYVSASYRRDKVDGEYKELLEVNDIFNITKTGTI